LGFNPGPINITIIYVISIKIKNQMQKYIAILRGINVGGHRKILMKDLRKLFQKMKFKNVLTYIQSGNVIFDFDDTVCIADIENQITNSIKTKYSYDVPVIVRKAKDLIEILNSNPFIKSDDFDIDRLALTFLGEIPEKNKVSVIEEIDFSPDRFIIIGKNAFVYCSGKYSDSKITNQFFENKLKIKATTRNWKTIKKLCELLEN